MRASAAVARNRSLSSLISVGDIPNTYSPRWSQVFLLTHDAAQTQREVEFLRRQLPLPRFRRLLDVCCGVGRHAAPLIEAGYDVTGVDRDEHVLGEARHRCPRGRFVQLDMRQLDRLTETFDAVICMWQSFGYFDAATNAEVLKQIGRKLKPAGRFVLDIYHREFFERNQGARRFERSGAAVTETKRMDGDRLTVRLDYESRGEADLFEWQLFTPDAIRELAERCGFACLLVCAGFDEARPASADLPRMQLVFERR